MTADVKRFALGAVVGALILFAVDALAWAAFPWVQGSVHDLHAPAVIHAIEMNVETLPGTYFLNASEDGAGVGRGLWGWMTVHPPEAFSFGRSLAGGFAANLGLALVASWLLVLIPGGYARRALVVASVGFAALLAGPIYFWAWAWLSTPYAAAMLGNGVLGVGLMAVILPKVVRARTALPGTAGSGQDQ